MPNYSKHEVSSDLVSGVIDKFVEQVSTPVGYSMLAVASLAVTAFGMWAAEAYTRYSLEHDDFMEPSAYAGKATLFQKKPSTPALQEDEQPTLFNSFGMGAE